VNWKADLGGLPNEVGALDGQLVFNHQGSRCNHLPVHQRPVLLPHKCKFGQHEECCYIEASICQYVGQQSKSFTSTCFPVEGKVSASRVRLSQTGEAASLAARLFLPCVTASLPAHQHLFTYTPMAHVRVGIYCICIAQRYVMHRLTHITAETML